MTILHAHHSAIADDGSDVGSNAWNSDHAITSLTFPPMTAPGPPVAGYTLYCDTVDGGLKAISTNGTVTLLAPGPSTVSAATWSTSDKNANFTVSGAGLVVTDGGGASDHVGRGTTATTAIAAGVKRYWEVKITTNGTNAGAGICNGTLAFPDGQFLGQTVNGLGYINDGNVWRNFTQLATLSSFTTGDVLGFAVDGGNKIWLAKNNVFSGVPGVSGGLDISAMGTVYPAYNGQSGVVLTANFGATFTYTAPSGFTAFP